MTITLTNVIEILTIISVAGGAIWMVATIHQSVTQLVKSVEKLTVSVDRLTNRVDSLEAEHRQTMERLNSLERTES